MRIEVQQWLAGRTCGGVVSEIVGSEPHEPRSISITIIPLTLDTETLARRLVWFEEPAEALADTARFVAYAAARATHEDMKLLRNFITDDEFREALDHAPPGIIDPRSWAYWNLMLDRYPAPPMPARRLRERTMNSAAQPLVT